MWIGLRGIHDRATRKALIPAVADDPLGGNQPSTSTREPHSFLMVRHEGDSTSIPAERTQRYTGKGDVMSATIAAPVDWVKAVGNLHLPMKADRRLQQLMDRNNDDLLFPLERDELEALVELSERLSLVRGEALQILGKRP